MERNVVVGGLLVSVSLVLSVMLNSYASREALRVGAPPSVDPTVDASAAPQLRVPVTVASKGEADAAQDDKAVKPTEEPHTTRETPAH